MNSQYELRRRLMDGHLGIRLNVSSEAIRDGATATVRWNEIVTSKVDGTTHAKLRKELRCYCGLDTRAMVEIWRVLVRRGGPTVAG